MSKIGFYTILIFSLILRAFLAPLVIVISNFLPKVKKRLWFERKNLLSGEWDKSFKAEILFHVSSEGELEQVRPLIVKYLEEGINVELLYTSESVEQKCLNLKSKYKKKLMAWRLPVLSFFPFSFFYFQSIFFQITAKVIVFCRYDFFPELLILKLFKKKMVLLSGSAKKTNWFKRECFELFDFIVAANHIEEAHFKNLNLRSNAKVTWCDFRIEQIKKRIDEKESTFIKAESYWQDLIRKMDQIPKKQKMIFGSIWPSDLHLLESADLKERILDKSITIVLFPHKLSDDFTQPIYEKCKNLFGNDAVFFASNDQHPEYKGEAVMLLSKSGILCELYSQFLFSYVGGGFEHSIHSVLEPFLAQSFVTCGPKNHRSAEMDFILNLGHNYLRVINNKQEFEETYKQNLIFQDHNSHSEFVLELIANNKMKSIFVKEQLDRIKDEDKC
jgi:3-deoxy-D-manno-octulosonic-acid transferase